MRANTSRVDRRVRDVNSDTTEFAPTVLLVDDDEFASRVADYLEAEHGFDVLTETDADVALDRLTEASNVSCVVSDYAVPGMDGLDFLDAVKSRFANLPFVLFTGQGSEKIASEAIRLGADDYLEKGTGETRYELLATRILNCTTISRQQQRLEDLHAAIEHAGHAVLVTDTDGTIVYANPTMEAVSGYGYDELKGATPALLKSGEHDEAFYRELWGTILDGEVWDGEVINERKNGEQYVLDQTISPITEGDTVTGFVAINRDITERRRRERELQMFREAVEQAGHVVFVTDTDGTIIYANPAFEDVTGYDSEEVIGNTPRLLKSGEHDAEFYRELWGTILDGEVWEGEIINERKNGEQYAIDQTIAPLTRNGEITGFVAINSDITELKEQRRELKRQNDRLEQFGRTVAHDLRNPLNVMSAQLDIARTTDDPDDAYDDMQTALDRMTELIDELLALAKQGKSVLDPEPASLEAVARSAWNTVDKGAMTLGVAGDATLLMDESRVQELFANLFRNAREHAGEDASVRVGTLPDGFFVEDDGSGIPPDRRDDVLESGFTTSDDGTGFGLAIVSQIAEAHDWHVSVTDGIDGGARFEFRRVETE
jgi:PAS domain S-box-containing protein